MTADNWITAFIRYIKTGCDHVNGGRAHGIAQTVGVGVAKNDKKIITYLISKVKN